MNQDKDITSEKNALEVPGEPLDNAKHEQFAMYRAAGMTLEAASRAAGYSGSRAAASRLESTNVNVQRRIEDWKQHRAAMVEMGSQIKDEEILAALYKEMNNAEAPRDRINAADKLAAIRGLKMKDRENPNNISDSEMLKTLEAMGAPKEWTEKLRKGLGVEPGKA